MKHRIFMRAAIAAIAIATAALPAGANPTVPTIPGIPHAQLVKLHIISGCGLQGANSSVQRIFGSYALAISGSGHIPQTFFPGGAPATADVGAVWCRYNRVMDYASDFMLVRYQAYTSSYVARKGFDLAVNMQNSATPDNRYTLSKSGSLTLAIRKYGEIIALSGDTLASAAWYAPAQQNPSDPMNRNVGGSALIPMMFALLCPNAASSC